MSYSPLVQIAKAIEYTIHILNKRFLRDLLVAVVVVLFYQILEVFLHSWHFDINLPFIIFSSFRLGSVLDVITFDRKNIRMVTAKSDNNFLKEDLKVFP